MIKSTYRSSLWLILLKSVPWFLVFEAILFSILRGAISNTVRTAAVPIGLIVAPGLLAFYILFSRITIQITDDEIRFLRMGKKYLSFPVSARYYSAYTQTNTFNVIFRFTARCLRVTDLSGRADDHRCYGFTRDVHARLVSELQAISGQRTYDIDPERSAEESEGLRDLYHPFGESRFIFPKGSFSRTLFKGFIRKSVATALIFLTIGASFMLPMILLDNDNIIEKDLPGFFGLIGFIFLTIGVIVLCLFLSYRSKIRKVPEAIVVVDNTLKIDDRVFRRDEIVEIHMTPVRYIVENDILYRFRHMRIITTNGQHRYLLGHIDGRKHCFCYPDYGELHTAISAFLRPSGKNVIMIMIG